MVNYQPELSQVDALKLKLRIAAEDTFKNVFRYNLSEMIIKEAINKTRAIETYQQHFVALCYGLTGKGKSNAMLSFARTIYPNIKVENIFFHNQQIIDAMPTIESPNLIFRDENVEFAQYGVGATRIKTQLEAITQTLRKKGISFIFVGVDEWELSTAQYHFEAVDMDRNHRITRFAVKDPQTRQFLGAIYLPVMAETDPFWIRYNEHKDTFMQTIINMDFSQGKPMYQAMIDALLKELNIHIYTKKKERKLYIRQRFSSLTNTEIEELSTMLEIQLRKRQNSGNDTDSDESKTEPDGQMCA